MEGRPPRLISDRLCIGLGSSQCALPRLVISLSLRTTCQPASADTRSTSTSPPFKFARSQRSLARLCPADCACLVRIAVARARLTRRSDRAHLAVVRASLPALVLQRAESSRPRAQMASCRAHEPGRLRGARCGLIDRRVRSLWQSRSPAKPATAISVCCTPWMTMQCSSASAVAR